MCYAIGAEEEAESAVHGLWVLRQDLVEAYKGLHQSQRYEPVILVGYLSLHETCDMFEANSATKCSPAHCRHEEKLDIICYHLDDRQDLMERFRHTAQFA